MAISISVFKNIYSNKPKQLDFSTFDEFEKFLYLLSKRSLKGKKDAELISPATYVPGSTRANKNVLNWAGWAAIDVDDHEFKGDLKSQIYSIFGDWRYVVYSTASSKNSNPKFRIVFALDEHIQQDEIRHFWFALQSTFNDQGDKQCKDFSRMYYTPATYDNAFNFIFSNNGNPIAVRDLLAKYPYVEKKKGNNFLDRLPDELQKQVIEHRKSKMDAVYNWSSYRDCPFWPRKLASEYQTITNTGWYHKMYQIMVAIAGNAIYKEYPITSIQIAQLCHEFDQENGNWYENRPLEVEADRALEYAYKNG